MAEAQQRNPSSERQREIFRFWDGEKERGVDPLVIWTNLWGDDSIDVDVEFKRIANNELESTVEVVKAARNWFSIKPFTVTDSGEEGLTDLEVCDVLRDFLTFVNEIKKKRGPLPMPSRLLLPQPPGSPSITPPSAASSSTPSVSPADEPTTICEPSPAPSAGS